MKKMFFTAIAVVAFSSASMANTIADEEVVNDSKNVSTVVDGGCDHLFQVVFWWSYQRTNNAIASNSMAFAAYDKCLGCNSTCTD